MSESPVDFLLINQGAFEITPTRNRLQSYPNPHLMSKSLLSPLQDDPTEQFRCFSLPRFDKDPPDPAPVGGKDILSTSSSSEQLRQREELLTEQHRKVVAERLQEQEEERYARQRLEDIINMCAQFVASNETSPSSSTLVASSLGTQQTSLSSSLSSQPTLRKSSLGSPNSGIKTNGSLKAATPSSEDELTAINNQKDSNPHSNPSTAPQTPQSPRNKIKTVVGIPSPKDPLGKLDSRVTCSTSSGGHSKGTQSDPCHAPSSLQQMAHHIHAAQASLMQSQYLQLEAVYKETLDELQMELALVAGELCDEQFSLKEDLIQFGKVEAEQEMLVEEAMREKEEERVQLQMARERILKWQELTVKMAETLEDDVSPALEREISERLENEVECLEAEKRAYEDLEFQILESAARRDERIEEVNQRIQMMSQLIGQKEHRIQELGIQQKAIQAEVDAKKMEWQEEQRNHVSNMKLMSQQQSSLDSESLSDSETDTESEYQHSNCGSEMVSSSTESEELFSPKSSAAMAALGVTLRNNNTNRSGGNRLSQRPLTCYLPVMPGQMHFDLRHHISSCGHQLELCRNDIQVGEGCAKGYLYKLGSASRWWKKRWFVFDRMSHALMYFMDKSERKLKGVIHFQAIEDVYVDHGNKKMSSFCVKTIDRLYHLSATSPEAMRVWVDIIFTGAQGYSRFAD